MGSIDNQQSDSLLLNRGSKKQLYLNLKTVVGIWSRYVSTSSTVGNQSILYLMCGLFHWRRSIPLNCARKKEQQSCKIIHFDGRISKESNFVSFLLLFPANQIGHNVSSSGSSTVWNCGKSFSLIELVVLTVSSVGFLCEPNTFASMLLKERGHMWNQNTSTCGLSIWMANAPHVSLKEKAWRAQEDCESLCRRWSGKEGA